MRVLLLQPEDSPRRGPWTKQSWDLLVDLGRSSSQTAAAWSEMAGCPLLRAGSFSDGPADIKRAGEILSVGKGRLLDGEGIDWWTLQSLEILLKALSVLTLQRLAREIPRSAILWATRPGEPAATFARIAGLPWRAYGNGWMAQSLNRARHYARLSRHFSPARITEIFLDKYDSAYRRRAQFASGNQPATMPVVLIPSAYTNVSRVACAYARLLPDQAFLLVATRRSATLFDRQANVHLRALASYAETRTPARELREILEKWSALSRDLQPIAEIALLQRLGMFDHFPTALANGLAVRNAWRAVLEREPVCGVLCGDDTNINTRLPVLLAAHRGLPTLDFHHGAMDGFYLAKPMPCDLYLAKNELERDYLLRVCGLPVNKVALGAPSPAHSVAVRSHSPINVEPARKTTIVLFSEPYENIGMRTEEVYRELLPALCRVARETERGVVLKLHPFESFSQRSEIVRAILSPEDRAQVRIVSGPLTEELLSETWAGVTVESTTVLDCAMRGIPCFLCAWLALAPFGYLRQYAKFGAGHVLHNANEVADVARVIAEDSTSGRKTVGDAGFRWQVIEPQQLAQWIGAESPELEARRA